jgi:hypothetical protein
LPPARFSFVVRSAEAIRERLRHLALWHWSGVLENSRKAIYYFVYARLTQITASFSSRERRITQTKRKLLDFMHLSVQFSIFSN